MHVHLLTMLCKADINGSCSRKQYIFDDALDFEEDTKANSFEYRLKSLISGSRRRLVSLRKPG